MIKKFVLILFLFCLSTFAQTQNEKNDKNLNKKVDGIVIHGNSYYLITDEGYIEVKQSNDPNDKWNEYYKKVYGDSVENPNTIIKHQERGVWPFRFFHPVIPIGQWADNSWGFSKDIYLYDFISIDKDGNYNFRPGVVGIINGIEKSSNSILPSN